MYAVGEHPGVAGVVVSGGGDGAVRVWDLRTSRGVFTMVGHCGAVSAVGCGRAEPQVVSCGGADGTVRLWDLAAGRCRETLTRHRKGVRCGVIHPVEYGMVSCSSDSVRKWAFPKGEAVQKHDPQFPREEGTGRVPACVGLHRT